MGSISTERELNKEERFKIFTPIVAIWEVLRGMVSSEQDIDKEYTQRDYAKMSREADKKINLEEANQIANELLKPLQIEKSMLVEKQKSKVSEIVEHTQVKESKVNKEEVQKIQEELERDDR